MTQPIRTRFAPSPTGAPHIGNIRTALFAWLFARHHHGAFLLRIEDTDQQRLDPLSIQMIINSLATLGLDYDEGIIIDKSGQICSDGPYGPYIQSQRLDTYLSISKLLLEKGVAYECYCSSERLAQLKREQAEHKLPPKYDRHCRYLTDEQRNREKKQAQTTIIRLALPEQGMIEHNDLVRGNVSFDFALQDDPVLLKSDQFPTYHLAAIADDHAMRISHVIRGEEWLSSIPKHLFLYQALGWELPRFAHLPIILGHDKTKLSKRHGATSVLEYIEKGYESDALINFLALLGWNPGTEQELFSRENLIQAFDIEKVQKSPAVFDEQKLHWMNQQYLKAISDETILLERGKKWLNPALKKHPIADEKIVAIVKLGLERIQVWTDLQHIVQYIWEQPDEYDTELLCKYTEREETKSILEKLQQELEMWDVSIWENIDNIIQNLTIWIESKKNTDITRAKTLWPLRVALTGLQNSPGVFETMFVLEKQETIKRITYAISILSM